MFLAVVLLIIQSIKSVRRNAVVFQSFNCSFHIIASCGIINRGNICKASECSTVTGISNRSSNSYMRKDRNKKRAQIDTSSGTNK